MILGLFITGSRQIYHVIMMTIITLDIVVLFKTKMFTSFATSIKMRLWPALKTRPPGARDGRLKGPYALKMHCITTELKRGVRWRIWEFPFPLHDS